MKYVHQWWNEKLGWLRSSTHKTEQAAIMAVLLWRKRHKDPTDIWDADRRIILEDGTQVAYFASIKRQLADQKREWDLAQADHPEGGPHVDEATPVKLTTCRVGGHYRTPSCADHAEGSDPGPDLPFPERL